MARARAKQAARYLMEGWPARVQVSDAAGSIRLTVEGLPPWAGQALASLALDPESSFHRRVINVLRGEFPGVVSWPRDLGAILPDVSLGDKQVALRDKSCSELLVLLCRRYRRVIYVGMTLFIIQLLKHSATVFEVRRISEEADLLETVKMLSEDITIVIGEVAQLVKTGEDFRILHQSLGDISYSVAEVLRQSLCSDQVEKVNPNYAAEYRWYEAEVEKTERFCEDPANIDDGMRGGYIGAGGCTRAEPTQPRKYHYFSAKDTYEFGPELCADNPQVRCDSGL